MKLSLSGRIAEDANHKHRNAMDFAALARMAGQTGYQALSIRPSQVAPHTPDAEIQRMRQILDQHGLQASMLCLHTEIAANTQDAARCLRAFGRDLDVAEMLGAELVRIGIKTAAEAEWIGSAADQARERGIRLAHQTHTASPFETVESCLEMLARINRTNVGLTIEPANLLLCGEAYGPEAVARLGPHIFNVYVQNLRLDPDGSQQIDTNHGRVAFERLVVGQAGGIDFAHFFLGLHQIGYDGYVTSHQPAVTGIGTQELVQDVFDYLRQFARR